MLLLKPIFPIVVILVAATLLAARQETKDVKNESGKRGEGSAVTSCTYYVSPSGSDAQSGTLAEPWKTLQKAFDTADAGQTVCLRGGVYPQYVEASAGFNQVERRSGLPGRPIVFTNYPGEIAVIQGSTKVYGSYVTFRGTPGGASHCGGMNPCGLQFEGSAGYVLPAVGILNSRGLGHVVFDHVEIRGGNYHAGFYQEGCGNAIIGSYIHDNGIRDRYEDNGIYWSKTPADCKNGGLIANNLVEHNFSKGIQLYAGASGTTPAYVTVCGNISVNNGAYGAVIWGDHNVFANNVLYGNGDATDSVQGGLYSGTDNRIENNLTWSAADHGGKRSGWYVKAGCCLKTNKVADPLFLDPGHHNWKSKPSSLANEYAAQSCDSHK